MCRVLCLFFVLTLSFTTKAGVVVRSFYEGGYAFYTAGSASSMKGDPRWPSLPTFQLVHTNVLSYGENLAGEASSSYLRGYIEAPETGEYQFFLRCDDFGELWVSRDHTEAQKQMVCAVTVNNAAYVAGSRMNMVRGEKYYFELFHVEGILGDWADIGWRMPDGTQQFPMSAKYVQPFPIDPLTNADAPQMPPRIVTGAYHGSTIEGHPTNQIAPLGGRVEFIVHAEGAQPMTFQWRRNGVPIPGATLSHFTIPVIEATDCNDEFDVVIVNSFGDATSNKATLNAGTPVLAATYGNLAGVDIIFPKAVDMPSALNTANYTLTQGTANVAISGVQKVNDETVRLQAPVPEGSVYTVVFNNIKDAAGAALSLPATRFVQSEGFINLKIYTEMTGVGISDVTNHPKFINDLPDRAEYIRSFSIIPHAGDNGPFEVNYGSQIRGFFTPLETGDYMFHAEGDDAVIVYLGTDDNPSTKREIINFSWPITRGSSAAAGAINLVGGRKYYIEGLHRENTATDSFNLMVTPFTAPPPAPGAFPLGPSGLTTIGKSLGPISITSSPVSVEVDEGQSATFQVDFDGALPWNIQWLRNGEGISGETNRTFTVVSAGPSNDGDRYTVSIHNKFSSAVSNEALLTLRPKVPPTLTIITDGEWITLTWGSEFTGSILQYVENLGPGFETSWVDLPETEFMNSISLLREGDQRYFRLRPPLPP